MGKPVNVILLHHSTGKNIWVGAVSKLSYRLTGQGAVERYIAGHNRSNGTDYRIQARVFPQKEPYGWKNYPYDYWNIWVEHGGDAPYKGEPTLEILTAQGFDVICWKHCFPVCHIGEDPVNPSVASHFKCLANYKLQYNALKAKMRSFPDTKFIVWTGAALAYSDTMLDQARRAAEFFNWVRDEWDEPGDNIFLWDFYRLETEGGLFLKDSYSREPGNSHPNKAFSDTAARLFAQRVIDVIEDRGDSAPVTGGIDERQVLDEQN